MQQLWFKKGSKNGSKTVQKVITRGSPDGHQRVTRGSARAQGSGKGHQGFSGGSARG